MKIPLIKPYINQKIKDKVIEVLESGYLTEGPVTHEFEKIFGGYVNVKHSIAVTSCTTGMEIALRAMGIGPGDEVIVPDYTYPATASVVSIVGAHCVIVDVNPNNMLIDYDAVEKAITSKTKAIIPVSLFGNPLDYDRLNEIKRKYGIYIMEDTSGAIGAEYKGQRVGSFADISVFSLHPRKFITTGEGGMITTNNDEWANWMNSYKHFGMNMINSEREGIQFDIPGTNYKLSNVQAAIGIEQMLIIDELLKNRRMLASGYLELFSKVSGIKFPTVVEHGKHSFQSFCILTKKRDEILKKLRPQGIEVQIGTYSLHMHRAFQNKEYFTFKGDLKGSIQSFNQCLTIPLYNDLSQEEQNYVVKSIKEFF